MSHIKVDIEEVLEMADKIKIEAERRVEDSKDPEQLKKSIGMLDAVTMIQGFVKEKIR